MIVSAQTHTCPGSVKAFSIDCDRRLLYNKWAICQCSNKLPACHATALVEIVEWLHPELVYLALQNTILRYLT